MRFLFVLITAFCQAEDFYSIKVNDISGKEVEFSRYAGNVVLAVNTASRCGFTSQYTELEKVYQKYKERGFVVLAFPSNDFNNQEPGTNKEIIDFCKERFGITFPIFEKSSVHTSSVFSFLTASGEFAGKVNWNFEKFLLDKKGILRARYGSFTTPDSMKITSKIEELLAE